MAGGRIIAAGWVMAAALAANAQDADPSPSGARTEEQLRRLLLEREEVPLTKPKQEAAGPVRPALPPDGSLVVARRCRIFRDPRTGWMVAEFEPEAGRADEPSRWLLPCERLEKMEAALAEAPGAVFRVSGETTVYGGRPFFLVSRDPVVLAPSRPAPVAPAPAEPPPPPPPPVPEQATTEPAATQPTTQPAGPTSEDILRRLMQDEPGRPMDITSFQPKPVDPAPSVAPVAPRETPLTAGPGELVVDRVVTVAEESPGGWKEARFKSDNTLREPPMRLLPCRMLEEAERTGGELRVSGVVTAYKGKRYLLLRKVMRERDMGQL